MIENSDDHYEIDISRARALLGWEPRHSLTGTLPEMIRRLKADPTDWYEKNKLEPCGGGRIRNPSSSKPPYGSRVRWSAARKRWRRKLSGTGDGRSGRR